MKTHSISFSRKEFHYRVISIIFAHTLKKESPQTSPQDGMDEFEEVKKEENGFCIFFLFDSRTLIPFRSLYHIPFAFVRLFWVSRKKYRWCRADRVRTRKFRPAFLALISWLYLHSRCLLATFSVYTAECPKIRAKSNTTFPLWKPSNVINLHVTWLRKIEFPRSAGWRSSGWERKPLKLN